MPRRIAYAALGAFLALGAPSGLCAVRYARSGQASLGWLWAEVAGDAWTYAYVLISTAIAFAAFGFASGRAADRLSEASTTDLLTGLRNRRHFQERLGEEFARAMRYATPLSLLIIDLDALKELNDRHGHQEGDAALRRAATAIREGLRATDIGARWGGDEFVVLAPNTRSEDAVRLAERVRLQAAANAVGSGPTPVTVSIGVATLDPLLPHSAPEALVRAADAALYEAKSGGRNRVIIGRMSVVAGR